MSQAQDEDPGEVDLNGGPSDLWVPAKVELSTDNKRLLWTFATETEHSHFVGGDPNVLSQFAGLGRLEASPEAIRDFARRYGILRICKHGLPATHSDSPYGSVYFGEDSEFVTERFPYCRPLGTSFGNENEGFEPLDRWRFFARHARALLNVMVQLNLDEPGHEEDWTIVLEHSNRGIGRDLIRQRLHCIAVVNTWLRVASVTPQIHYDHNPYKHEFKNLVPRGKPVPRMREGYRIEFETEVFSRGSRLFAYLACQLMTAAVGKGVGLCSGCGKIYTPKERKPKRNQNNFCSICGKAAAKREASRRWRANEREKEAAKALKVPRTAKKTKTKEE